MASNTESQHRLQPTTLRRARELRQAMVPAERFLWARLRDRRLEGLKFRRQVPIGKYIADFVCEEHKLVIELEGSSHAGRERRDAHREIEICSAGFRMIQFVNEEVFRDIEDVLQRILTAIDTI